MDSHPIATPEQHAHERQALELIQHPIVKEAYERWDGASLYFLDPNGYTLEFIYFDASKV